jgi:hypothetical protein
MNAFWVIELLVDLLNCFGNACLKLLQIQVLR